MLRIDLYKLVPRDSATLDSPGADPPPRGGLEIESVSDSSHGPWQLTLLRLEAEHQCKDD